VARMREMKSTKSVSVGKHEGKRPLVISRRRCEDNIKTDLEKWSGMLLIESSGRS
jgi:hypothetical protein